MLYNIKKHVIKHTQVKKVLIYLEFKKSFNIFAAGYLKYRVLGGSDLSTFTLVWGKLKKQYNGGSEGYYKYL